MGALDSIGSLSLQASSQDELQEKINRKFADMPAKQRRTADRINTLLRHLGRGFKLAKFKPPAHSPKFLTMGEFQSVVSHFKNEDFKILAWVAITTGMRLGEIFAIQKQALRDGGKSLRVDIQAKLSKDRKKFVQTETKSRKKHITFVLPEGQPWIQKWLELSHERKLQLRQMTHSKVMLRPCKKLFGSDPQKQCNFHDLRHSYAIHLVNLGVPLTQVAMFLGNSITVCEKYYTGFVATDHGIEMVSKIVARNQ